MYLIFSRAVYNTAPFLYSLKEVNKIFLLTFNSKIYNKHYTCYSQSHEKQQSGAWKVLFFGTDEFAVESLKVLYSK